MKKIHKITATASMLVLPAVAFAQEFDRFFRNIENIVNRLVPIFITITLLVFIWGIIQFITASGDEDKRANGRQLMIWGVIALAVVIGIWGLVNLLLGAAGVNPPATPQVVPRIK